MDRIFSKASESQVTSAIVKDFSEKMLSSVNTDCIVVGAGPSGLVAARELSKEGFKVIIIESNNYLGGGFWIGGYLMNGVTVRAPANKMLDELNIPSKEMYEGLYLADGPHACSKLIASACDAQVKVFNMTKFDDVVYRNNKVAGVVVNWTPVSALPRQITCVDPIALESKLVIDATGHDAVVCRSLERRGIIKIKDFGPMDVESSEDLVVEKTGLIHPGLVVTGMAVSTVFGIPRMGPTFGGMLLSGMKAAKISKEILNGRSEGSLNTLRPDMVEKAGQRQF